MKTVYLLLSICQLFIPVMNTYADVQTDSKTNSFWDDSSLKLHFRTYAMERERQDSFDSQAWAVAGILRYQTGWWQERLQLTSAYYTSQGIHAPKDKPGTQLLKTGQVGYGVLAELNAVYQLTPELSINLGRQLMDLPFININYARILPNTHEAYLLKKKDKQAKDSGKTDWLFGYIPRIKHRNSDKFVWISERAGVADSQEGLLVFDFKHHWSEDISLQISDHYAFDLFNTFYTEFKTAWALSQHQKIKFSLQASFQQSIGDELLGEFTTNSIGMMLSTDFLGLNWKLAGTTTTESPKLQRPFGVSPSYLSIIIKDFDRPGEDAWMFGLSYDFEKIGLPGLSSFMRYAKSSTPDQGVHASADQDEFNLTFDYRFQDNFLEGLWLRARYAKLEQSGTGAEDLNDFHFILSYTLPLF